MTPAESASSAQVPKKTQPEEYDLVILGDGTGSTLAAWTFASEGKRVAVVERKFIGGSCPNIACLPSKNIIDSAKIATYFRGAERGGIAKPGSAIDMPAVLARKRRMVSGLERDVLGEFQEQRRGADPRRRTLHWSSDFGSDASGWGAATTSRSQRHHQHWHARRRRAGPGNCRRAAVDACGSTGTR